MLSLVIALFLCSTGEAATTYATDLMITKTDGIWTDSRAFTSIGAAVINIGALERDLYIAQEESVTDLTIPANIRLHFLKTGAINNSGQLTINTTQITAKDQQIFTGTGDIDFADGTIVRSTWFSDIYEALDVTSDDAVTVIVAEPDSLDTSVAVGDYVILRWESPFIISINPAVVLSNLKNIEAGNYQLFAGLGDIDFLDGSRLKLSWFNHLRAFNTWIEDEEVTLVVSGHPAVTLDETLTSNITIDFAAESGRFVPAAGVTITIHSPEHIIASPRQQIVDTTNNAVNPLQFTGGGTVSIQWWDEDAGDGATECADAFQLAIDSNATPSTESMKVKILDGNYILSSEIDIISNLWIQGDGEGTYLDFSGLGVTENAIQFDNAAVAIDDFKISDLRIFGPESDYGDAGKGIFINSSHHERFRAENLRIENFSFGIWLDGQVIGEGPTIINNWIDHFSYAGIKLQDCQNAIVSGNTLDGIRTGIGDGDSALVGIWHISEGGGFGNLYNRIVGNTVKNTTAEGILIRGKHASVVGNTVHDGNRGIVVEPFSGNTPTEDDGRMYVTISGNTIETMDTDGITIATDTVSITQGVSDCIVSNNTIFNIGKLTADATGIRIGTSVDSPSGENNIVIGNLIRDAYYGIYARDTNNVQMIGNIVQGVTAYGIYLVGVEGATVIGGSVSTDGATPGDGINISGAQDVLIQGVSIIDVDNYGIHLHSSSSKITIANNRISDQKLIPTMIRGINSDVTVTEFIHYNNIIEGFTAVAVNNEEIRAAAPALSIWGPTSISGIDNAVNATLADGKEIGDIKTIVLSNATNQPHTVTVAHHVTSDPEVCTFAAVDETWILIWTGTEWADIYQTCTP